VLAEAPYASRLRTYPPAYSARTTSRDTPANFCRIYRSREMCWITDLLTTRSLEKIGTFDGEGSACWVLGKLLLTRMKWLTMQTFDLQTLLLCPLLPSVKPLSRMLQDNHHIATMASKSIYKGALGRAFKPFSHYHQYHQQHPPKDHPPYFQLTYYIFQS